MAVAGKSEIIRLISYSARERHVKTALLCKYYFYIPFGGGVGATRVIDLLRLLHFFIRKRVDECESVFLFFNINKCILFYETDNNRSVFI